MAKVTVRINGMEYNLKGKEDEAYLQHLASYVEDKLEEILRKNTKLSVSAASVLTAINLADESFKGKRELSELIDTHEILKRANKSIEVELEKVKDENSLKLKNKDVECKKIIQDFKLKLEKTQKEKKIVELEVKEAKEKTEVLEVENNTLQSQIVELQEELKEELFNNSNETLEEEIEKLKKQIGFMETENKELKNHNKLLKQASKDLKFDLQSCKYRVIDLENKFLESQIIIATEKAKKNNVLVKNTK